MGKMCQEFEGSENGGMVENNSRKREKEKAMILAIDTKQ